VQGSFVARVEALEEMVWGTKSAGGMGLRVAALEVASA
jgi:hypothetical protein